MAVAGVDNVITKRVKDNSGEVNVSYGSFGSNNVAISKNFTESMRAIFNIGIVGKNGSLKNCNVHDVAHYSRYRNEMGD